VVIKLLCLADYTGRKIYFIVLLEINKAYYFCIKILIKPLKCKNPLINNKKLESNKEKIKNVKLQAVSKCVIYG
jgi:hypothetical protein